MISILVVDVVGRYVFQRPTLISFEMTGYLLVGITFLALAYGLQQGSHVRVTVVVDYLPASFRKWLALIIASIELPFIIILMWKSIDLVKISFEMDVHATTPMGTTMWMPQIIVPIGLGIFALEIFRQLIVQARQLFKTPVNWSGVE